ncbi:hypothetical protein LguiA_012224 [Lonicera macranthoides]
MEMEVAGDGERFLHLRLSLSLPWFSFCLFFPVSFFLSFSLSFFLLFFNKISN